ncbi:hypothetical protein [Streptomyces sp. KL116D]|uniref:hypothetical protein n=1 Tax=Streptomyces sp. KL116D TaxID=3045152 RepID=UPI003558A9D6
MALRADRRRHRLRRPPRPLADPGRRLRAALGLRPGAWILVRPDGYVAARGSLLTRPALRRALPPAGGPRPARRRGTARAGPALRATTHDFEEH